MSNEYMLPSGNAYITSNGTMWDGRAEDRLKEAMQELAKRSAQPKLDRADLPWDEIADGTATGIAEYCGDVFPIKEGYFWHPKLEMWKEDETSGDNTIIATRPTPKLSAELRKELEAFKGKTVDEVLGGEL